ncbi:MAG TPA: PspA/IM30 family protein [Aggregatilineaceae bacterium]|nr:PspA/IM30 family protein [Aggregatilineaceae bacterium]
MSSLIDKLNVLVKSSVHGVLGDDSPGLRRHGGSLSPARLGKDIDHEIGALRQQVDSALDSEDHMEADIQTLQRQIADWDQQADQALTQGNEATARYAARQMQLEQRRRAMLEADLAQHRISTSELIQRVNELETVVAEARRRQPDTPAQDTADESLAARLRQARQQAAQSEAESPLPKASPVEVDERAVDDDLARRRARLSQ